MSGDEVSDVYWVIGMLVVSLGVFFFLTVRTAFAQAERQQNSERQPTATATAPAPGDGSAKKHT